METVTCPQCDAVVPAPDTGRIRFGDGTSQTVPAEWAEAMLRKLQQNNPKVFGTLLVHAAAQQ